MLEVLNERILSLSVYISKMRYEYIKKIERIAKEIQLEISSGEESLSMSYISNAAGS